MEVVAVVVFEVWEGVVEVVAVVVFEVWEGVAEVVVFEGEVVVGEMTEVWEGVAVVGGGFGNPGKVSFLRILLVPEFIESINASSSSLIECISASARTLLVFVGFLDMFRIPCIFGEYLEITDHKWPHTVC